MVALYKGDVISSGDKEYVFLTEPKENYRKRSNFSTWSAVVQEKDGESIFFLKFAYVRDKIASELLEREAKFKMYYPFIEHIYEDFISEDRNGESILCVLAEYVDGVDLETYRRKTERILDEDKMFRYMMQLLRGVRYYLEYIKDDSYVHRDLKPANIMISEKYDKVVISDFDWAHIPKSKATEGYATIGGTRGYADPRALKENKTDVKMDIYGLGRIFCFWMRGRDYFTSDECEIYEKDGQEELAYSFYLDRIPFRFKEEQYVRFCAIVAKMVAEPKNRYGSISDIIEDMENFLKEYYGGVKEYEKRFHEPLLLSIPKDYDKQYEMDVSYCWASERKRKNKLMQNYSTTDVLVGKIPVMMLYCLENKLYYVPVHPELKKLKKSDDFEVKDGDEFLFQGDRLDIGLD